MPTPTYTPLATVTLGSSAASVTFSSIPATYRDLILIVNASSGSSIEQYFRFNSDTGSNYSRVWMLGNGSSPISGNDTGTSVGAGDMNGMSNLILNIMDYSATDKHKTVLIRNTSINSYAGAVASRWASTTAINTIAFSTNSSIPANTTVALYGIAS